MYLTSPRVHNGYAPAFLLWSESIEACAWNPCDLGMLGNGCVMAGDQTSGARHWESAHMLRGGCFTFTWWWENFKSCFFCPRSHIEQQWLTSHWVLRAQLLQLTPLKSVSSTCQLDDVFLAVTRARIEFDSPAKMILCLDALCNDSAAGSLLILRVRSLGISTTSMNSGRSTIESHATAGFRVIGHKRISKLHVITFCVTMGSKLQD